MNRRKEKRKEAKKKSSIRSQHFLTVLNPCLTWFYGEDFPSIEPSATSPNRHCRWLQQTGVRMLRASLWDLFPVVLQQLSTVRRGIMLTTCGIHLGCLWHSTTSLALTQLSIGCAMDHNSSQLAASTRYCMSMARQQLKTRGKIIEVKAWVGEVNTAAGFYRVVLESRNGSEPRGKAQIESNHAHILM